MFNIFRSITSSPKTKSPSDHVSPLAEDRPQSGTRGSVSWTAWKAEDKDEEFAESATRDICRTYTFSNIGSAGGTATLTIVCALKVTVLPDGETASLDRKLRFYLRPFRLPHEANFVMRLTTRDETHGGEFDVMAAPSESKGEVALIEKYGGRNDVATCVATLRAGRDMVFMLRDEQESLSNFLLPNDGTFQRLYDETIQLLQQRAVLNHTLHYNAELQRKQKSNAEPQEPTRIRGEAWKVRGSGHEYILSRKYFSSRGAVEIICTVKSSPEVNFVVADLRFNVKSLRLKQKESLVVGFFTDEPKGALVEVEALPVPEAERNSLLDVVMLVHREDAHKLLRALASGGDLHFAVMHPASPEQRPILDYPFESLAHFVLLNDGAFKKLYKEAVENVSQSQDATHARQLREGWYRRRTPGLDAE